MGQVWDKANKYFPSPSPSRCERWVIHLLAYPLTSDRVSLLACPPAPRWDRFLGCPFLPCAPGPSARAHMPLPPPPPPPPPPPACLDISVSLSKPFGA